MKKQGHIAHTDEKAGGYEAGGYEAGGYEAGGYEAGGYEHRELVQAALCTLAARDAIDASMPRGFTGDPAVVILLHLFTLGGRSTLGGLAAATGLSTTIVLRWCAALQHERMVEAIRLPS